MPPRQLKGALEQNFYLDQAERLLNGQIYGPECLISRHDEIYTGLHGGEIIKITNNNVSHITKIGLPCGNYCVTNLSFKIILTTITIIFYRRHC